VAIAAAADYTTGGFVYVRVRPASIGLSADINQWWRGRSLTRRPPRPG
jgi:hypothetical protein